MKTAIAGLLLLLLIAAAGGIAQMARIADSLAYIAGNERTSTTSAASEPASPLSYSSRTDEEILAIQKRTDDRVDGFFRELKRWRELRQAGQAEPER